MISYRQSDIFKRFKAKKKRFCMIFDDEAEDIFVTYEDNLSINAQNENQTTKVHVPKDLYDVYHRPGWVLAAWKSGPKSVYGRNTGKRITVDNDDVGSFQDIMEGGYVRTAYKIIDPVKVVVVGGGANDIALRTRT